MSNEENIKVWDIGVRVFHWSLVFFFTLAYLTGDEESWLHNWSGYAVTGLVMFRLLWGVVGTRYARFWNIIVSPARTIRYARSLLTRHPEHYTGHNPLGGWMVAALLVTIGLTSWTGLELEAAEGRGPLAMDVHIFQPAYANGEKEHEKEREESNEFWEELHEFFADLTVLLIFIHIIGVLFSSVVHRENLVKAMVTGYKKKKPA